MKKIAGILLLVSLCLISFNAKSQCSVAVREAFGTTTGSLLYNSYLAIGSIGDMYGNKVIDNNYAKTLANEQVNLMTTIIDSYKKVINESSESFTKDDKDYLKECNLVLNDLKLQANYLSSYITSSNDSDLEKYSKHRAAAWAGIEKLLDL